MDETNESHESLQWFRKEHIEKVLAIAGNDVEVAAKLLGISPQKLRLWITRLGIVAP